MAVEPHPKPAPAPKPDVPQMARPGAVVSPVASARRSVPATMPVKMTATTAVSSAAAITATPVERPLPLRWMSTLVKATCRIKTA